MRGSLTESRSGTMSKPGRLTRQQRHVWVNALRSGSYSQTKGYLRHKGCHCALGVLAETLGEHGQEIIEGRQGFYHYMSPLWEDKVIKWNDDLGLSFEQISDRVKRWNDE